MEKDARPTRLTTSILPSTPTLRNFTFVNAVGFELETSFGVERVASAIKVAIQEITLRSWRQTATSSVTQHQVHHRCHDLIKDIVKDKATEHQQGHRSNIENVLLVAAAVCSHAARLFSETRKMLPKSLGVSRRPRKISITHPNHSHRSLDLPKIGAGAER
jgi:hypothetical protein